MDSHILPTCTAFLGDALLASGARDAVTAAARTAAAASPKTPVLTFDDVTGAVIDLDLRAMPAAAVDDEFAEQRGRGRPKLGVVAREVTLLPQHWAWLAAQPGGASVTLRKLVHAARSASENNTAARRAAAYKFMSAMAGNLPGFEEAARALFAGAYDRLAQQMAAWPADVRAYALRLANG
jgi:hypothetical protein